MSKKKSPLKNLHVNILIEGYSEERGYHDVQKSVTLLEAIKLIPGEDGWWKSDSASTYAELAQDMIENGLSPQHSYDILRSAYWAAADCFGG